MFQSQDHKSQGEFSWDSKQQGLILGSFFYGNIIGQIPGGLLAERFGGKWVFLLGILFASIVTILTPLGASLGVGAFIGLRALQGLGNVSRIVYET